MKLFCHGCSQAIDGDDLCPHRGPVCWGCCEDHHRIGNTDDDYDEDGAA